MSFGSSKQQTKEPAAIGTIGKQRRRCLVVMLAGLVGGPAAWLMGGGWIWAAAGPMAGITVQYGWWAWRRWSLARALDGLGKHENGEVVELAGSARSHHNMGADDEFHRRAYLALYLAGASGTQGLELDREFTMSGLDLADREGLVEDALELTGGAPRTGRPPSTEEGR